MRNVVRVDCARAGSGARHAPSASERAAARFIGAPVPPHAASATPPILQRAPGFCRLAFAQQLEFAKVDFAQERDAGVRAAEDLVFAIDDRALTDLGNVILPRWSSRSVRRPDTCVRRTVRRDDRPGVVFMVLHSPSTRRRSHGPARALRRCSCAACACRRSARSDAGVDPRTARLRSRYDDVVVVRKRPVAHAHVVGGARCNLTDAGVGFEVLESGSTCETFVTNRPSIPRA